MIAAIYARTSEGRRSRHSRPMRAHPISRGSPASTRMRISTTSSC